MGIKEFAKHIYAYFIPESNDHPNLLLQPPPIAANTVNPFPGNFSSLVPVIGASGDVVYYIERPIIATKPSLINEAQNIDKPIPVHPQGHQSTLYKRLPDGQYVPVENPPAVPATKANTIQPPKPPVITQAPPSTVPVLITSTGNEFVWDGWPDGYLSYDLDLKQVKETGKLQVHWAIATSGGYGGSKEADCWEEGSKRSTRYLGVIECDELTCQIITRPHVKPARIAAQLGKPCRCGGTLVRNECNVMSYLWHWSGGIHYEHKGHHLHRRPTHLLHLLPHERTHFEELVSSHPKSGPLQLVIGVPGLRGPGKSAAEISDVLLNAHRVGKARAKIIKGHTKYQKPLQKRLLPGLGALAKHGDFWYPVRLMHYNQASKTWNVLWWRGCSFSLSDIVPGTVTEVQESQIVDALWQDRTTRHQIRLGKWVHAIEVITDEDILSDPSYTKYTEEIDEILSKSRRILTQLMLTPKSVQNIDEVPALKWLKAKRKPLSDIVPFAGDLSIKERSQISNWFEAKIAAGNENRRYRWLGLVPLAHAFTLYILAKLDVETLDTMDRNSDKENGDNTRDESTSNKQVQTPLERAWHIQTHPGAGVMWNNIDIDKDCLSILEYDMFERSQIAGIAGNWQWGLDAGDHQEKWNPYEGMYSDWFVSNRDSESESERQRGYYYVTIGEGESERKIGTRTNAPAQQRRGKAQGSKNAQKKATRPVKK